MIHIKKEYNKRIQDSANLIPKDEPVFLVRAHDQYAVPTLRHWADHAETHGHIALATQVRNHALKMEAWQKKNGSKIPD